MLGAEPPIIGAKSITTAAHQLVQSSLCKDIFLFSGLILVGAVSEEAELQNRESRKIWQLEEASPAPPLHPKPSDE